MLKYIVCLLIILMSGSVYGWSLPGIFLWMPALCIIYMIYKKWGSNSLKVSKNNFGRLIALLAILVCNIALTSTPFLIMNNLPTYLLLIGLFCVSEVIGLEEYNHTYINIMCFLAATSLLFWFLSQFDIVIGSFTISADNNVDYWMNPFYIYRWASRGVQFYGINPRNQGIFWEPGAFQGYLNWALLLLLNKYNLKKKQIRIKAIVLMLTIASTQSTTGYFVFALVLTMSYLNHVQEKGLKIHTLIVLFAGLVLIFLVLNSNVVQMKFSDSSTGYESFLTRLNDNINGIKIALISPVFGLGYSTPRYFDLLAQYGIVANSSGILCALQEFGLFFGSFYLLCYIKGQWKSVRFKHWSLVIFIIAMLILNSGEVFITRAIFLIYLFRFTDEKLLGENK